MVNIFCKKKAPFLVIFLYYYAKIVGLCPLNLNRNLEFHTSSASRLYAIFISILYIILFCWSMVLKYSIIFFHSQINVTVLVDGFVHILQLTATIFIWLTFAFRQKRLQNIVKSLQITGQFSGKLNITNDLSVIIQIIATWVLVVFLYFTIVFIINQIFYSKVFVSHHLFIWVLYRYPHVVIHHTYFLFISVLQIIEQRFLRLNIVLKKIAAEEVTNREIFGYRFSSLTVKNIAIAKQLHSKLKAIVEDIGDLFAVPVLLSLTLNFVHMISSVNIIYRIIMSTFEWNGMNIILLVENFFILFSNVIEFFFISTASGNISNEANNTGVVLCKIWINSKSNRKYMIKNVLLYLLQNQLSISLHGLIDLNYEYIYRIFGIVLTHLIIVLQFK